MVTNLAAILILALLLASLPAGATAFYVLPTGSDSGSGKLNSPFASIARARDAIRALKQRDGRLSEPVTVYLRGGTYFLKEPVEFTSEDSGTELCPITYAAYRNERPIISGGREITRWKQVEVSGKKLWAAEIPEVKSGAWAFTQLFVNGERRSRPRLPKQGFYSIAEVEPVPGPPADIGAGQDHFRFNPGELNPNWRNLGDVDIVALMRWFESRMPIQSIDGETHTVHLVCPSVFSLKNFTGTRGCPYFVENVFEALDTAGEWYLERKTGVLYYIPMPGENMAQSSVIAPMLPQLIRFKGTENKKLVEHIELKGLTFSHTQWFLPSGKSGFEQADFVVPGAIPFKSAHFCTVSECVITHIGNYGLEVDDGCDGLKFQRNTITDMGAGGVNVKAGQGTLIEDNEIYDGGKIFTGAVGVLIMQSGHNQVLHNDIHDLYYTGVSIGWTWGYDPSPAIANLIEYNHIYNIGRGMLSDMGGIYTLGVSPGTQIRNNLIHDCTHYSKYRYGGAQGIYLDAGSSDILVENNVVYNTQGGGLSQTGTNDLVRNNIFALSTENQLRRLPEKWHSLDFQRNIVYWTTGDLLAGGPLAVAWQDNHETLDNNLYWQANGKSFDFVGKTLAEWQKLGHDPHSLIADPEFVAPDKYDFTLKSNSPAFKLGFKAIDLSTVGPRKR